MDKPVVIICDPFMGYREYIEERLSDVADCIGLYDGLAVDLLDLSAPELRINQARNEDDELININWVGWPILFIFQMEMMTENGLATWKRLGKPLNTVFISITDPKEAKKKLIAAGADPEMFVWKGLPFDVFLLLSGSASKSIFLPRPNKELDCIVAELFFVCLFVL